MESEKQKHKKQPWGNVECFAFGGVTVRFAPSETSSHAANHTIPPPPSCEGSPTLRQGQKPLAVSRRKNQFRGAAYNYNKILNTINVVQKNEFSHGFTMHNALGYLFICPIG